MFIVLVYGFGSGQFLDLFFGLVVQFEQTRNDRNNNRSRIEINKIASNPKLAIASQKLTINLAKVLLTLWNEPKHLVSITAPAFLSNYHTCIRPCLLVLNLSISESLYFHKLKVVCLPASLPISDAVCQYVFFYLGFVPVLNYLAIFYDTEALISEPWWATTRFHVAAGLMILIIGYAVVIYRRRR